MLHLHDYFSKIIRILTDTDIRIQKQQNPARRQFSGTVECISFSNPFLVHNKLYVLTFKTLNILQKISSRFINSYKNLFRHIL